MTKSEKIGTGAPVSWQDIRGDNAGDLMLATQIMNVIAHGIIVRSPDGTCELHNTRVFDLLEFERDASGIGTRRDDFLDAACVRGEFSNDILAEYKRRLMAHVSFQYDRSLPSGRVVATYARSTREGGYVVTSTDVAEARQVAADLAVVKQAAEDAEAQAREILPEENGRAKPNRARCQTSMNGYNRINHWMSGLKLLPNSWGICCLKVLADSTYIPIHAIFWIGPVNGAKTG